MSEEQEKSILGIKPTALVESVSKLGPTTLMAVVFCLMLYFNHVDSTELNKSIGATLSRQVEALTACEKSLDEIARSLQDMEKDLADFVRHHHTP